MDGTAKESDVAGMRGDLAATRSVRLDTRLKPESHRSKVSPDVQVCAFGERGDTSDLNFAGQEFADIRAGRLGHLTRTIRFRC